MLTEFLRSNEYAVDPFLESKQALTALKNNNYHVLITDLAMPKIDGLQLINYIQKRYTLILPWHSHDWLWKPETAISAMRLGAFDYILKPFKFGDILTTPNSAVYYYKLLKNENLPKGLALAKNLFKEILGKQNCKRKYFILRSCLKDKYKFENIIGVFSVCIKCLSL